MDRIVAAANSVLGRGSDVRAGDAYARVGRRDFSSRDHCAVCDCDERMEAAARDAHGIEHADFSCCGDAVASVGELARENIFLVVLHQ